MTTAKNSVGEQCSISGLGDIQLGTALAGARKFGAAYNDGDPVTYRAEEMDGDGLRGFPVAWENGRGVYNAGADTITRGTVLESSNAGAQVNFGSGLKRVFVALFVQDLGGPITAADITDSSATGRAVLTGDAIAGRSALGLGSASLLDVAASGDATAAQVVKGDDSTLTNDRTASGLRTATTVVSVSAATAPSAGQTLVATSSTAATWQTPAGGISAADLAGGTLPASLTTLATSGLASLSGLTLSSAANAAYSITYEDNSASLLFRYAGNARAAVGIASASFNNSFRIMWNSTADSYVSDRDVQLGRNGVNRLGIGTLGVGNDGALELGAIRKKPYTVGTLPVAPSAYDQCLVVDALAPAIGSAVVGGGGVAVNVIWISPNWVVI